ncbi:MAG: histidine kinase, partial [Chloroflexi bacterium]
NIRRTQGFATAQAVVATGQGKQDMDEIREIIGQMEQEQRQILQSRSEAAQADASQTTLIVASLTILNFALLPLMYLMIRRDIAARQRVGEAMAQARDQALEASRLKSEFLATMSHEIRTPMNGVIGMTELLLDTPLDDDQREFATVVRDSGQALLTIINDILDFSKIEAGKLVLDRVDFEVRAVVEGVAEILSAKASEKGLSLFTFIAPEIPPVQGDPGRLRQILLNLVGNAVKFTAAGEIVVQAALESADDSEIRLRFTVQDTGIGLSEPARARLFEPFTQADSSTTRKYGGTGLGLAISKRLVELMDGQIGVQSVEGQGSTFWVTARFDVASQASLANGHRSRPELRDARILIIDDSSASRDILCHYAASWCMQADSAATGSEGLATLRTAATRGVSYDLAIVDLAMPDMDGFAVARAVQRDPDIVGTPLILLTAFDERGQGEQALGAGFGAYLTKPVKQSHLFDAIANLVTTRTRSAEPILETASPDRLMPSAAAVTAPPLATASILLAEDNPTNQKMALLQLEKLGFKAEAVANGRKAVDAVVHDANSYALILMDVQMPELDGLAATRAIRKAELTTGRHIPIIAMTANAMQGDREACIAAGMDDYISKPVNRDKLLQVLERWLPVAT